MEIPIYIGGVEPDTLTFVEMHNALRSGHSVVALVLVNPRVGEFSPVTVHVHAVHFARTTVCTYTIEKSNYGI